MRHFLVILAFTLVVSGCAARSTPTFVSSPGPEVPTATPLALPTETPTPSPTPVPSPTLPAAQKRTNLIFQPAARQSQVTPSRQGTSVPTVEASTRTVVFSGFDLVAPPCCPQPDVNRAVQRVSKMEGVARIEVRGKQIRIVYDPSVVALDAIANALYLQGIALKP